MKILFIIDPLDHLDHALDTSLGLLREYFSRGHETWICDTPDLSAERNSAYALAARTLCSPGYRYILKKPQRLPLGYFDLVLMRKEPPFDAQYITATYILELVPPHVVVSNSPAGIRDTNEKMSILRFREWIPETLASCKPAAIAAFQKRLNRDLVIKPLDLKGGSGIFLLRKREKNKAKKLTKAAKGGAKTLMAQEFLHGKGILGDKRILLLDGRILTAYEKRFKKGEFRANISLGGTVHPTVLTRQEKSLAGALRPYLIAKGLHLAGIDVLGGKLIEINVTCPAGLMEAKLLYPQAELVEAWADSLERKVRTKRRSG